MNELKIRPVLIGADMNCYNTARAFHEKYGVKSTAFGRYQIGITENTKIIEFHIEEKMDDERIFVDTLLKFAKENPGYTNILIGCTDGYVEMISKFSEKLSEYYIIPYADYEKIKYVTSKDNFYGLCEKYGILYPGTVTADPENYKTVEIPFPYPIIIKPSVSADYWKHEFEGMKKVYRAKSEEEAREILEKIYGAGYPDKVIIQDCIPGNDAAMYVLTAYSDKNAKVRKMCLGHVLLEEHTPKGLGNHCAIMTEYKPDLCENFKKLLEGENFIGFSNFDIKFDERDGTFRAFEINTRQGRSNYYMTAAGFNIAECFVSDRVENTEYTGCEICSNEIYWHYVPTSIVYKYSPKELSDKVRSLIKSKKEYSSTRYSFDLKGNPKRLAYILIYEHRHKGKFKKYYHP